MFPLKLVLTAFFIYVYKFCTYIYKYLSIFPTALGLLLRGDRPQTAMDTIVPFWRDFGRVRHREVVHPMIKSTGKPRAYSPVRLSKILLRPWPKLPGEIRTLFMAQNVSKKRRMSPSQSREDGNHLDAELKKLAAEAEPSTMTSSTESTLIEYRPTYRAMLARKRFITRESLGSGSYSKVKLAIDVDGQFAERVAVKIIDRTKAPEDYQEKFLPRELDIWPNLRHNHLIQLYEVFQDNRRVYMLLEYAAGGDVLKYIQDKGAVTEILARKWFLQVADAVRYMHNLDITHRDLKLENLLLDSDNNIKICDFGFTKQESSKCLSKTYCGSKSYAAPEILLGRPYQPSHSDVWAMGVILYILVTGKMPFDETKGTKSILEEQRRLTFRWPRTRKVSGECQDLIKRMFTWNYNARPNIHQVLLHPWFHAKKTLERTSNLIDIPASIKNEESAAESAPIKQKRESDTNHRHHYPHHPHAHHGYHRQTTSSLQTHHHQSATHYSRPHSAAHTTSSSPSKPSDWKVTDQQRWLDYSLWWITVKVPWMWRMHSVYHQFWCF